MARYSDESYLKQWRKRQVDISMSAAVAFRMNELHTTNAENNDDASSALEKVLKNCIESFTNAVQASAVEDDNANGLAYLRNYTHAYYLSASRQNMEGFTDYFRFALWAHGDQILREALGDKEVDRQRGEASAMERYIALTVHMYCNRLLSLAQDREMWIFDDEELIAEYKILHMEFEEKKKFDEIAAIRYQLMHSVVADSPFYGDEAACNASSSLRPTK